MESIHDFSDSKLSSAKQVPGAFGCPSTVQCISVWDSHPGMARGSKCRAGVEELLAHGAWVQTRGLLSALPPWLFFIIAFPRILFFVSHVQSS